MPLVKVGSKRQITIPKQIFEALEFRVGDVVEMTIRDGKVEIIPKQVVEKTPVPKLSKKEQELLESAKTKIAAINKNILTSKGLTRAEAEVAAKVGLIDPEQKWWWMEEWQKGEREAEKSIIKGELSGPFQTAEELITHLRKQKA